MNAFRLLNNIALVLCFVVIVLGAYVRLSDAGLGCPDWPGCYGHIGIPNAPHEVEAAEAKFPERPVEAPKAWKEMIHRYFASTLGLLIVAMAVLSVFKRNEGAPRVLPWALVAMVIFQGILGMWTVTWQLKPLAVSAHLLGGMATLSLLLWLRLRIAVQPPALRVSQGVRRFAALGLMLVVAQIFLGGWTSSNYAALACPDLPTCHGSWWPNTDFKEAFVLWRGLGTNYEFGVLDGPARVTIHFVHRLGAVAVTLVLLSLAWLLWRDGRPVARALGAAVAAALTLQVTIGLSVVYWSLPLWLAAAHNAGAAVLMMMMVALNVALRPASRA